MKTLRKLLFLFLMFAIPPSSVPFVIKVFKDLNHPQFNIAFPIIGILYLVFWVGDYLGGTYLVLRWFGGL
jgi:hypothetical protein